MSTVEAEAKWRSRPARTTAATAETVVALLYVSTPTAISHGATPSSSRSTSGGRARSWVPSVIVAGSASPPPTAGGLRQVRGASSREVDHERQEVREVARDEERAPHVLPAGGAHPGDQLRIVEEMADPERRALDRVARVARHVGDDLLREAARVAADHGLAFPHRLGGAELEPRADRFLQDDRRRALERVDLTMRLRRQLEHDDVGVLTGGLEQVAADRAALRFLVGRARQNEPHVVVRLDEAVGVHDAHRVVSGCEGPDLHQQRLVSR